MTSRTELMVIALDGFGGRFDGQIAGALERAESGGAIRVLEALVVGRDQASGDVTVLRATGGTGGLLPALTAFRLDRGHAAERLGTPKSAQSPAVRQLGDLLRPGMAIVALRLEHRWESVLADALGRAGGRMLTDDPTEPAPPEDVAELAFDVARRELAAQRG